MPHTILRKSRHDNKSRSQKKDKVRGICIKCGEEIKSNNKHRNKCYNCKSK